MKLIDIYRLQESGKAKEAIQEAELLLLNVRPGDIAEERMWLALKHLIADAFIDLKQYQKAIDTYDEILMRDFNDCIAWGNRGHCRYQVGDHDDALSDYDQAIELKPSETTLTTAACLSWQLGLKDKARKYLDSARRLFPNSEYLKDLDEKIKGSRRKLTGRTIRQRIR